MRSVTLKNLILMVLATILLLTGNSLAADRQLRPEDQKVVNYLVKDWGQDTVTSVDVAMDVLKLKASDEARFRIGSYIKAHPELHEVIRRWGWVTLVLTPDEKLIARALINAQRDGKPVPGVAEIAKAVDVSEAQTKRGLAMLGRYEIIKQDNKATANGYTVQPQYVKWEPRLDFLFHKVSLDSGRQFNTN